MTEQPGTCGYEWVDGWGEHYCHLIDGHDGDHRCHCDFTTRVERSAAD